MQVFLSSGQKAVAMKNFAKICTSNVDDRKKSALPTNRQKPFLMNIDMKREARTSSHVCAGYDRSHCHEGLPACISDDVISSPRIPELTLQNVLF
jgi:hypothetical protein